MRRGLTVFIIVLVMAGARSIKYDERIELNPDGSGVVRMHLALVEQMMPPSVYEKSGQEDDLFPMPRKELLAELEKDGFTVKSLRAESTGGMRHFYIVLGFKNLDTLARSEWFGKRKATLRKIDGKWRFDQEIRVSEQTLTGRSGLKRVEKPDGKKKPEKPHESIIRQMERRFGRTRVEQMLRNYLISFSVQVEGGGLLATNGRRHRDRVAVWAIPLSQLIGRRPTIRMVAEFAPTAAPAEEE